MKRISQFRDPSQIGNLPSILKANLFQKLIVMFKFIFVSPSKMKFKYHLKSNWEVFIYYPKRVLYLIRDHKSGVLKTLNPDNELMVKSKEELKWRMWVNDAYFQP